MKTRGTRNGNQKKSKKRAVQRAVFGVGQKKDPSNAGENVGAPLRQSSQLKPKTNVHLLLPKPSPEINRLTLSTFTAHKLDKKKKIGGGEVGLRQKKKKQKKPKQKAPLSTQTLMFALTNRTLSRVARINSAIGEKPTAQLGAGGGEGKLRKVHLRRRVRGAPHQQGLGGGCGRKGATHGHSATGFRKGGFKKGWGPFGGESAGPANIPKVPHWRREISVTKRPGKS